MDPKGSVIQGSTVELTCIPRSGDLPFDFSWRDSNGMEISSSAIISIVFHTTGDIGRYTCVASNPFGSGTEVVNLIRAGKSCTYYYSGKWDFRLAGLFLCINMHAQQRLNLLLTGQNYVKESNGAGCYESVISF